MGLRDACGRWHWGIRWSSLWGHKRVRSVPKWMCVTHAGNGTGAFGGAPYRATKRMRGVPKRVCVTMRAVAMGHS
eukprot:7051639-Pyramimonas_sp.AAC.1